MTSDATAVACTHCGAEPGGRCMMVSAYARKPHAVRVKLALVLTAHADPALDAFFPKLGPCALCVTPGLDQRHRMIDAMAGCMAAGDSVEDVADDYDQSVEAVQAVLQWAMRWPEMVA